MHTRVCPALGNNVITIQSWIYKWGKKHKQTYWNDKSDVWKEKLQGFLQKRNDDYSTILQPHYDHNLPKRKVRYVLGNKIKHIPNVKLTIPA